MARNTVQSMITMWKSNMHDAVASYGSESWALAKQGEKRIDAFEMWAYRRLLRVSWTDKRTTSWVLEKVGTNMTLRQNISARKMRYFGHVMRKNDLVKT